MLRKLIANIRRRPKQTRDNVAFGIASTVTFLVAFVWLVNAPSNFSGMLGVGDADGEQTGGFMEAVSAQTAAVKEAFTGDEAATESVKDLISEYRATGTSATSTQPGQATTSSSTRPAVQETQETFTTESSYETAAEMGQPREARIQVISKSTTSTTTAE